MKSHKIDDYKHEWTNETLAGAYGEPVRMVECPYCQNIAEHGDTAYTTEIKGEGEEWLTNVVVHRCVECRGMFLHVEQRKVCSCGRWGYLGWGYWRKQKGRELIAATAFGLAGDIYCRNCGDGLVGGGMVVHEWKDHPDRPESPYDLTLRVDEFIEDED